MKKHLYEIKRLEIPAYLKWWFIKKKFAGTLSEVLENLTSPITLQNSLRRKFKIFEIGGNSVQNGEPTPTNEVPIQNVTGDVEVKVENGNLFDVGNNTQDYIKASGITPSNLTVNNNQLSFVVESGGATIAYRKQNLKGNKQYTLKAIYSISGGRIFIRIRSLDNTRWLTNNDLNLTGFTYNQYYTGWFLEFSNTNAIKAFSIPDCSYWQLGFGFSSSSEGTTQTISNIQLVEGTYTSETMPDYEAHEQQTVIFPLSEGQVLHERDTIEDKIIQNRVTYQFTGTESFSKSGGYTTSTSFCCYTASIRPAPKVNGSKGLLNIGNVCNVENIANYSNAFAYNNSNALHFLKIQKTAIPNWDESLTDSEKIALFKAYLAQQYANGTPVTLEYELETPIETEFTQAQATAKAQIDSLHSYKGTTYISSENNPSPTFKIQYVKEDTNESTDND